jgi:hypothetical protein
MELRQLGDLVGSYGDLVSTLRARLEEVGAPLEAIDHVAGLAPAYTSKLVSRRRMKIIGKVSLGLLLETLGLKLAVLVDDRAFEGRYRHRLPRGKFNRWHKPPPVLDCNEAKRVAGRELKVSIDDLGGVDVVERLPALRAAVIIPVEEEKAPKTRRFDPAESHPMPARRRPMMFGRGTRKASSAAVPEL